MIYSILLALANIILVTAQDGIGYVNSTIGTCADVNCTPQPPRQKCNRVYTDTVPVANCTTIPQPSLCQIYGNDTWQTYQYLGINQFSPPPDRVGSTNWSWTVGYAVNTQISKYYYFGFDAGHFYGGNTNGYAVFLMDINAELKGGTCETALPTGCAADLEKQALSATRLANSSDVNSTTTNLTNAFKQHVPPSCANIVNGTTVHTSHLFGPGVSTAAFSDNPPMCHPTLPMSNDLQYVYSISQLVLPLADNLDRVVGVLTVVEGGWAHLECLAAYLPPPVQSSNGAGKVEWSLGGLSAAVAMVVAFLM